jgi:hypothetical protein
LEGSKVTLHTDSFLGTAFRGSMFFGLASATPNSF